jgi:DNA-directed RNA polymerase subunit N (RpoN/RPB10)
MIIPVRCFTCNKVIGASYEKYKFLVKKSEKEPIKTENVVDNDKKEIFEKLGIERYCCVRHMISQVDLIEQI